MDTPDDDKKITLSKKQAGFGSVIVVAIMILNPVKEWFFTREEGKAQAAEIQQLRADLHTSQAEFIRLSERNTDKILEALKESEKRFVRDSDRLERRVEKLEANVGLRNKHAFNN